VEGHAKILFDSQSLAKFGPEVSSEAWVSVRDDFGRDNIMGKYILGV
jgi:hypothetical protein